MAETFMPHQLPVEKTIADLDNQEWLVGDDENILFKLKLETLKAALVRYFNIEILHTDWGGSDPYTVTKPAVGLTPADIPLVYPDLSGVDFIDVAGVMADFDKIYRVVAGTDEIVFYANASLSAAVTLNIKVL